MNPNATSPRHQPETEFLGELQEFSGAALAPDDPILEPRVRTGRPGEVKKLSSTDKNGTAGDD